MADDSNIPASKGDLERLGAELLLEIRDSERRIDEKIDAKFETVRDEIIRAFQMAEESIRKESAHVDEVAALDNRVTRIEAKLRTRGH